MELGHSGWGEEEGEEVCPDEEENACELHYLPEEWVEMIEKDRQISEEGDASLDEGSQLKRLEEEKFLLKGLGGDTVESTEEGQSTQPEREDLDKQRGGDFGKRKKEGTWGPVLAERKSKRNVSDGRSVMEKAQDLKKVVNLEEAKVCCMEEHGSRVAMRLEIGGELEITLPRGEVGGAVYVHE